MSYLSVHFCVDVEAFSLGLPEIPVGGSGQLTFGRLHFQINFCIEN